MAYIHYINFDNIPDDVGEVLDNWYSKRERPDNIIGISGCNATALDGHMALYRAVMYGPSPLSRIQREMIGVVTSGLNNCFY